VVYCAFEGNIKELRKCDKLLIIIEPFSTRMEIELQKLCAAEKYEVEASHIQVEVACDSWLEFSIDFGAVQGSKVQLRFEIERDGVIIQTLPGYGELEIDLDTTYAENWFV